MNNETDTMYYIHKDYLGSYDVITDARGNVLERLSFDPWGRRRNPSDWTFDNVPSNHLFDRGYTGHEHLDVFSLINMNGRVYDPWLGRFLSPDPFVQSPAYSQSFNRYSYCYNNPLKYIDPSGYTADLGEIIDDLWNSPHGGTWTPSTGIYYFHSEEEAYGFGTGYMHEHGYSYKNISRRNKGYNQWKYPWINPGNGTFQTDPVYNWVYTGDSFWESDVSIGDDWLFLNTISASNDDFIQEGEDIVASSDVYYPEGLYSYDKTYIQFLSAEGVGLLGGWSNVKGSARVYSGSDGKYYVNVSATAYTPASRMGDVTFYGTVDVLSGNKVLSSSKLHPFSGPSIIQTGRQDIGSAVITLPGLSDNEVYLRFNVGYSYTEGAGFVSPIPSQGHYRIKVGYIIDAWTH